MAQAVLESFQFHIGSIKRIDKNDIVVRRACFNSTLVQLKEALLKLFPAIVRRFNSTLVQLKA